MEIYKGKKFNVCLDRVILPNGKEKIIEKVEHKGSVVIFPILNDKIILIRQFRPVINQYIYELPAGTLEGNNIIEEAKRELLEETGYEAREIKYLFKFYPSPGISTEIMHVVLAKDLTYKGRKTEEGEVIEVEMKTIEEIKYMILKGEIIDGKTIASFLYYINYL
jgi:NTP pyrophosphohydrolases including oxidative damage repair enzymes